MWKRRRVFVRVVQTSTLTVEIDLLVMLHYAGKPHGAGSSESMQLIRLEQARSSRSKGEGREFVRPDCCRRRQSDSLCRLPVGFGRFS